MLIKRRNNNNNRTIKTDKKSFTRLTQYGLSIKWGWGAQHAEQAGTRPHAAPASSTCTQQHSCTSTVTQVQ